ncbi:MAG: YciI family protein [Vicinamibacteraceae bacterium]
MRYMMFIKHTEDYRNGDAPASLYEEMGKFIEEATQSGNFVAGAGLQPSSAGARAKLKGGKITLTDGPFTESKEIVGGYAIMDAKSREEALALARRFMELHLKHWPAFEGECEVRTLEEEAQPAS